MISINNKMEEKFIHRAKKGEQAVHKKIFSAISYKITTGNESYDPKEVNEIYIKCPRNWQPLLN